MFNWEKSAAFNAVFICLLYAVTATVVYLTVALPYAPDESLWQVRFFMLALFTPIIFKYVIHFLIAPWYPLMEFFRARKAPVDYAPTVSVLIPARNEEKGIEDTIRSVLDSHYPKLELIVVNDGSTDRTHDIVTRLVGEHQDPTRTFRYISIPNSGKAAALNKGLADASGEILVTIDSDSIMEADAIGRLVSHFTDARVASVAGNVIIGNRTRPIGLIQQLEYLYGFYFKRADSLLNAVYIVGGAAAAYRTEIVRQLGGFDEDTITEDIELSTRLQYHGYRVRYAANAIVYTEGPSDISSLCRQRLRWKFGRLQTFYKYRDLFFSRDRRHNFFLTFIIFPIALFAEILLFFEGVLLTVFYAYTFYTHDFVPLFIVIFLLAGIICWQILVDARTRFHMNLLILAPGAWLIFYLIDCVEYQALMRSVWCLLTKKSPTWQPWARQGVFERIRVD